MSLENLLQNRNRFDSLFMRPARRTTNKSFCNACLLPSQRFKVQSLIRLIRFRYHLQFESDFGGCGIVKRHENLDALGCIIAPKICVFFAYSLPEYKS